MSIKFNGILKIAKTIDRQQCGREAYVSGGTLGGMVEYKLELCVDR